MCTINCNKLNENLYRHYISTDIAKKYFLDDEKKITNPVFNFFPIHIQFDRY